MVYACSFFDQLGGVQRGVEHVLEAFASLTHGVSPPLEVGCKGGPPPGDPPLAYCAPLEHRLEPVDHLHHLDSLGEEESG